MNRRPAPAHQARPLRAINSLVLVGASVRAVAQSAVAAGYEVIAFDLFADMDLCHISQATHKLAGPFPDCAAFELMHVHPDIPWMYTGGIENHPELIREISQHRRLLGNSSEVVADVRRADVVQAIASRAGWTTPRLAAATGPRPAGTCLFKPISHCGGFGIQPVDERGGSRDVSGLFEQWIPGPSFGGAFLADGRRSRLLGVTRQYLAKDQVGCPVRESHPFAYVGSTGPIPLSIVDRSAWMRLGAALLERVPLVGLFGVDAVYDVRQNCWTLIEVNPRFTASMELIERNGINSLVDLHVKACLGRSEWCRTGHDTGDAESVPSLGQSLDSYVWHAKRILYAPCDIRVTQSMLDAVSAFDAGLHRVTVADIPWPGQTIEKGRPVLTMFGDGPTLVSTNSALEDQVNHVLRNWESTGTYPMKRK